MTARNEQALPEGIEVEDTYLGPERGRQVQFYADGWIGCSLHVWGEDGRRELSWIIQTGDNTYDVAATRKKANCLNAAATYIENIERVARERAQAREKEEGDASGTDSAGTHVHH